MKLIEFQNLEHFLKILHRDYQGQKAILVEENKKN